MPVNTVDMLADKLTQLTCAEVPGVKLVPNALGKPHTAVFKISGRVEGPYVNAYSPDRFGNRHFVLRLDAASAKKVVYRSWYA